MSRRSLTFRLVSWYCGLLLVVGIAFAAFTYASFDHYLNQSTRSSLTARADAVWGMANGLLDDKPALAALIEERFAPEAQNRMIRISGGGDIYYQSQTPTDRGFDPQAVPITENAGDGRFDRRGDLFLYARTFTSSRGQSVTVECDQSGDLVEAVERRLVVVLVFGLPVLLIVAAAGGYVLVRRALSPVQRMIEAAEALTFNSPRNRLPISGTEDRIDALGRTLNRMLERLDLSYQHASRFSADAAHELRTPLSIIRGELELLAAQPLAAEIRAAVANTLSEAERLGHIVESLMALAQMESVTGKRAHLAVDLRNLAVETIDQIRLLAVDKGLTLIAPSGAHVMAAGDRDRLKQVLVNLLDNAIKYTRPGGSVVVSVEAAGESAILTVRDTGIGIAPEDRSRIFDRFFRVATDRGEEGAGLGLAIVRSICIAHGGTVTVDAAPGGGSVFQVTLPLASSALMGKA
jgi:signal transduction histidine kinase